VLSRPLDRLGRSVDASIYRLIPQVVVRPKDLDEVRALLRYARERGRGITFRTAGTSLSGQAVTDDVLVELAPYWSASRILDGGRRVWAQPGVVAGYLNRVLAPLGYRLGPDPASIDAAMMGGILANNASGMCCGVVQNAYHTLDSLVLLLADGTLVDTSRPDADDRLGRDRPDVHAGLRRLRDETRADAALAGRIRRKFARKNTTAYSLHALLDHDSPAQILAHLMVGSEGTLGFLAEATLRTVPELPERATALVYFAELTEAGTAVAPLVAAGAVALEIMDAASLRSQADERRAFAIGDRTAAILAEFRGPDADALRAAVRRGEEALAGFRLLAPVNFTTDPAERNAHWHLRKGLFPAVGGRRASGTAVLIEDVVVPVERLAEAIGDLQVLFLRHGFPEAVIFGHARDGNLHFVFSQDFSRPETAARYGAFMRELVDLVVGKYDGALKAEHGTGRNMAPFVRDEWGEAAYTLMKRIKRLLDPDGILNPGVLLNDDPGVHLKALKPLPSISPTADRCMECGFCEPRCPSRTLTLSPRQRIVITREMTRLARLGTPEARAVYDSLAADFEYEGARTCAGDSMCKTSCPVKIDTGALVKEMKAAARSPAACRMARVAARRFGAVAAGARFSLRAVALVRSIPGGARVLDLVSAPLHRVAPLLVPRLCPGMDLPAAAPPLAIPRAMSQGGLGGAQRPPAQRASEGFTPERAEAAPRVVYFPSCLTRILGARPGEAAVPMARAMLDVLEGQGFSVVHPGGVGALCCGMPFASKYFTEGGAVGREPGGRGSRGDRRVALCRHAPGAGGRTPRGDRTATADARFPRVLGGRSAFRASRLATAAGNRRAAPHVHAREDRRPGRPVAGRPRPQRGGGRPSRRRMLRLRRRPRLPGPRADGERDGARGGGRTGERLGTGRRLLLHVPHVRDRDVPRRGPAVSLARPPRPRGAPRWLSGSWNG
jgi:D-lactate dehydrogenase